MKRILTIIALTLTSVLATLAQTVRPLKVYIKGGLVDNVNVNANADIAHSRLDLSGTAHADYVSVIVTDTEGRERQYLIAQVDSLVLPTGRRVVFHGGMMGQPVLARQGDKWVEQPRPGRRRTSFRGTFPGTQGSGNVTFYWTENDHIRLDVGSESRATGLSVDHREARFTFDSFEGDAQSYLVYYPDKQVTIPSVQTQTGANNTDHVGPSGDSGTAIATRQDDGSYSFELEHKAAYLCFLPHIDHLPSVRLEKIVLTSDKVLTGTYQLGTRGIYDATQTSTTVTLNLVPRSESDFFIGHDVTAEQDSCAAYMVIAPGSSYNCTATYYVTDTLSHISKEYRQTFSFSPSANTVYPVTCHILDTEFRAVDLGLSCNWSNVNVGAAEPSAAGTAYATDTEANAALLEQTVVTEWLMPDDDQRQELLEKCTWQRGEYNGRTGWFVTGASAAKEYGERLRIFLPCSTDVTPAECLASNYRRPVEALMVDLGLSVKWASRNVGANSVSDCGYYYAWGELEPKDEYTPSTYKYWLGSSNYTVLGNNYDISGMEYDVALVKWGGLWRMPTRREMQALVDSCTWTYTASLNGQKGYIVTGRGDNPNKIFLPMAGYMNNRSNDRTTWGSYFTSTLNGSSPAYAHALWFSTTAWGIDSTSVSRYGYSTGGQSNNRYYGRNIRAVASANGRAGGMVLNILTDSAEWSLGQTRAVLHGTLSSSTPIEGTVRVGFVLGDAQTVVRETARRELNYPQALSVGQPFEMTTSVYDNMGYWYRAFVETADGSIVYGNARHYALEMVDLGLPSGTLWANANVGASWPYQNGEYYAWGETAPQPPYTQNSYDFYQSGFRVMGDNGNIGMTAMDAAHVVMGNAWRMPTKAEMRELISNCEWTYTSENGQVGYRVTGKTPGYTDRSIFLPTGGYMDNVTNNRTTYGSYFTADMNRASTTYAFTLWFSTTERGVDSTSVSRYGYSTGGQSSYRYFGRNIRAVASPNAVAADSILHITTDSAVWQLGQTEATLHATLSSTMPLREPVSAGFVIGDDRSVTVGSARMVKPLTLTESAHFSQPVGVYQDMGYWYRAYVVVGGQFYYGVARHYGLEMVDLGLRDADGQPVLWANMNVGASTPEESGSYYAWGETATKSNYTSTTYLASTNANMGTDYNISDTEQDAAHVVMGSAWVMPTFDDWNQLNTECQWELLVQDGVYGYRVTGPSGRSIFLPSAGYMNGTTLTYSNTHTDANYRCGSYWSSIQSSSGSTTAYTLSWRSGYNTGQRYLIGSGNSNLFSSSNNVYRYYGRTVRAVARPNAVTGSGDVMHIRTDSADWQMGDEQATLHATLSSTTPVSDGVTVGFVVGDQETVSMDGDYTLRREATLGGDGRFSASVSLTDNLGYWYRAYVQTSAGEVFYGQARHVGLEMVDLGLPSGLLWANMNVGASAPAAFGSYFAWGEVSPKENYTSSTYAYGRQDLTTDLNITGSDYDAAMKNMGINWRMPTKDEWEELNTKCVWGTLTTQDNVSGYRVTGPSGRSIFLPSTGYMNGTTLTYSNTHTDANYRCGSYWSSIQSSSGSTTAYTLSWRSGYNTGQRYLIGSGNSNLFGPSNNVYRYYGRTVRAVATKVAPRP